MGKDFQVREVIGAVGSGRFEVTAILAEAENDPYSNHLGQSLVQVGGIKHSDFLFRNIEGRPHVIFKVSMGTNFEIYPLLAQAQAVFNAAIANALSLRRAIKAIELADTQASKEKESK